MSDGLADDPTDGHEDDDLVELHGLITVTHRDFLMSMVRDGENLNTVLHKMILTYHMLAPLMSKGDLEIVDRDGDTYELKVGAH